MKGKVPRKIKVGGVDYTVHMLDTKDTSQYGVCLFSHQRIYLSPNQLHQQASDTLLHEVMHAVWHEAGLDFVPDLHEEIIVRTMATGLRSVIRDNPQFVQFITDASEMWAYGPTHDPDKEAAWAFGPKDKDDDDE